MKKLDAFEQDILNTYEAGEFKSTSPSKADLAKFKAAASATFIKDRRINSRCHVYIRSIVLNIRANTL